MKRSMVFAVVAAMTGIGIGYAQGQKAGEAKALSDAYNDLMVARQDSSWRPNGRKNIPPAFMRAIESREGTQQAMSFALTEAETKGTSSFYMTVMAQNRKLIEQNDKIIALLQKGKK